MNNPAAPQKMSVLESLANKNVLILGATGFLGKVLFAMMLEQVPTINRIFLLIRSQAERTVLERFTDEILRSPALESLRSSKGDTFEQFIKSKVKILDGDASLPSLGMDKKTRHYLATRIDLVINSAGLVDFFPEVDRSLNTNTFGAIHAAEFTRHCSNAKLIHISTCYVAPSQDGTYLEEIHPVKSKEGFAWDAHAELTALKEKINDINSQTLPNNEAIKAKINLGKSRAELWGFNNTYCYTKALAEALLTKDYPDIPCAIIRPSIIESALSFPIAGWNEGGNTTAPLSHLIGGWYPYIVAKKDIIVDIIPVDVVCQNILLIASALLSNRARRIYQLGTSDSDPLRVKDIILYARKWYQHNRSGQLWENITRYIRTFKNASALNENHAFTPQKLADLLKKSGKLTDKIIRIKQLANIITRPIQIGAKFFRKIAKINRIFQPFTHDNYYVFSSKAIHELQAIESNFNHDMRELNWQNYWMNTHMPGLDRWIFPQYTSKTATQDHRSPRIILEDNLRSLVLLDERINAPQQEKTEAVIS